MRSFSNTFLILLFFGLLLQACSSSETATTSENVAVPTDTQEPIPPDLLPTDPNVRIGTFDNGLTYYIRTNQKPENRAELRLVVNAGSLLENDDQLGLAHFTEHMAFNGTTSFEKQALINYLESFGMQMGPDLNAYTSFDETVYMLQVPTDSSEMFKTAIHILREWATGVTFENEEIDKERGVVIEEWRLGRGASARIQDQQLPVMLQGSRYAERLPIGTVDILENFEYDTIKQFYTDWYRPELMAVVAVGDFDADEVEAFIKTQFEDMPAPDNPRPRPTYTVPDHAETLFAIAGDPEATSRSIGILYKQNMQREGTIAAYRKSLVESLYNSLFNARLQELTQSTDPPFIYGGSGKGSLVRTKGVYSLQAMVRDDDYTGALTALLTEGERVRQHGFTSTELAREKTEYLRYMERAFNERDKTNSGNYASEYVRHYLTQEPIPGIVKENELMKQLLPTITLEEVNAIGSTWITDENRVILVDGPSVDGTDLPSEAALLGVFSAVAGTEIAAYEENVSDAPLLATMPVPGTIVETEYDEALNVTRLTLSNGIKVVLKPTDFKNDEVLLAATSPGGTSLVPDSLFIPASTATTLIGQSGLGAFGPIDLQKKLAGKVVQVSPSIGSLSEGFSGTASPTDLETLFQLVHLYVTQPRADEVTFASFVTRIGSLLETMKASPDAAFRDTLGVTLAQYHFRARPFDEEVLSEMNLEASMRVYQDRFADMGEFTFYLVGSFDAAEVEPLLTTYLASLPSNEASTETWRDVGIRTPEGVVKKEVYKGLEPQSKVELIFTGPAEWSQDNRRVLNTLEHVLNLKLREVLREDMGGTYGVGVSASISDKPVPGYRLRISFGCDPGRAQELIETTFGEIESMKQNLVTDDYLVKARETMLRRHELGMKENNYWLSSLVFVDDHNLNPSDILEGPQSFLDQLDAEQVKQAAQQYLNINNYVQVVLYPENFTP